MAFLDLQKENGLRQSLAAGSETGQYCRVAKNPASTYLLWIVLAAPFAWLTANAYSDKLVYGELLHLSGRWSVWLTMLAMSVTPFRRMFPAARWPNWLLRRRRHLGVAAFAYALVHTIIYLERKQSVTLIVVEGAEPAMLAGWLAFLAFALLALTSNDRAVAWLRGSWKRLHRLVYPAALLMFAHWVFTAFDVVPGLAHFAILCGLETYRFATEPKAGIHG